MRSKHSKCLGRIILYGRKAFYEMTFDNLISLLAVDPKLITGVLVAFGAKELLAKFVERYWQKQDEGESDHKKTMELTEKVDCIIEKLDKMEENDRKGAHNDLTMLETNLVEMQNRAIVKGKVSSGCMPRYLNNYEMYIKLADETENYEVSHEVKINHQRILKLVEDGHVVDDVKEWYK